jgi:GntR family transcriptional regulator
MSPSPRYEVINRDLSSQISTGAFKPGHRLQSESKLAAHYGVSRMTVRQALDELESDGLVVRRHGAGTMRKWGWTPMRSRQ